jgi:hypothetical protein
VALQQCTSSGTPLTSDLDHAPTTGPFSTTSTSQEIFHPTYAMDTTCYLLELPVEVRYRIYDFAFEGAGYAVVQRDGKIRKCHSASNLPIGFLGACPLLQAEVEQWMTYSLRATLVFGGRGKCTDMLSVVPRRYLDRVYHLLVYYRVLENNPDLDKSLFPNLENLTICLGSRVLWRDKDEVDSFFKGPRKGKYDIIN